MRQLTVPLLLLLAVAVSGCPCCGDTQAGDPTADVEVVPMVYTPSGSYAALADGDTAPIIVGGQGGMMLIAGAQARNVDTCGALVFARLLGADGGVLSLATRERNLVMTDEQTAETQDEDGMNGVLLFPCDYGGRAVHGQPHTLEVTVTDRNGRMGTGSRTIIPRCDDEYCERQCSPLPDGGFGEGP